jgi:hypothetical protein
MEKIMGKESHQFLVVNMAKNLVMSIPISNWPGMTYYSAFLFMTIGSAAWSLYKGWIES